MTHAATKPVPSNNQGGKNPQREVTKLLVTTTPAPSTMAPSVVTPVPSTMVHTKPTIAADYCCRIPTSTHDQCHHLHKALDMVVCSDFSDGQCDIMVSGGSGLCPLGWKKGTFSGTCLYSN